MVMVGYINKNNLLVYRAYTSVFVLENVVLNPFYVTRFN